MKRLVLAAVLSVGLAAPAWADFQDGLAAYERGDYETALRELKPLAEQGDAEAQSWLGWMYLKGQGVPQDYEAAARWYRLAAEQGDVSAQMIVGLMYLRGEGVQEDRGEAVKWIRMAAERGNADAMSLLGLELITLDDADYVQAYMWLSLAAAQGDDDAEELRSTVAKLMTAAQIADAERLAREWKPKTE